jgi:hypothetical protein
MRIVLVCVLFYSTLVFSSPTIFGPSGLIEMPSAQSMAYKQANVALDYAMNKNSDNGKSNDFYYKVNLGFFEHWELGILGGSFLDEGVFVNAKYFLMASSEERPLSIAAGMERLGSNSDMSVYLVTSKRFLGGLNGHFGFKAFIQNNLFASAMLGVEYFSDEKVSFLADIAGERGNNYILNGGTRVYIDNDISLRIYLIDITKSRAEGETLITFGISLSKYI